MVLAVRFLHGQGIAHQRGGQGNGGLQKAVAGEQPQLGIGHSDQHAHTHGGQIDGAADPQVIVQPLDAGQGALATTQAAQHLGTGALGAQFQHRFPR